MIDKYNEVGISALEYIETANMAMTGNATAKPAEECMYPRCEDCINYHGHWCTVPMVISKQIWRMTEERLWYLNNRIDTIEELVTAKILGSKYDEEVFTVYEWEDEYGHQCFPLTYEDAKNLEADGIQLNAVGEISSDML